MKTSDLVSIARDFFISTLSRAIQTALFKYLPFLGLPILRGFTERLILIMVEKMADFTELKTFFLYTDFRISKEGSEYVKAKCEYDKNPSEENLNALKNAFDKFIRL
jgi:hypothetical protein